MATKVKPSRLQVSWTAQVWQVPVYVDEDTFQWWAWWGGWASFWRFLSLWDSTTWMPISFPEATPYTYITWDYFLVEVVSSATPPVNYKPNGSSYTGTASSTVETDEIEQWDVYIYDGTDWLLQSNHWKTVAFANIAGSPSDNTALANALWDKQDALTLPATPTQWHLVTWWADNETLADGWAVPGGLPAWWTNWQVLMMVNWTPTWVTPADNWFVMQALNSPIAIKYIWAGQQSAFDWLSSYDNNTHYDTI